MSNVPMSHPAVANKNPDGTYTVRIQHTTEGSVTNVDFTNVLFAATLANAYADMLNGKAAIEAKVSELVDEAKPAFADASADVKKLIAEAEVEAGKLIDAARAEAADVMARTTQFAHAAQADAEKLVADARAEADRIVAAGKAAVETLREELGKKPAPTPEPAPAPAAKAVEEE